MFWFARIKIATATCLPFLLLVLHGTAYCGKSLAQDASGRFDWKKLDNAEFVSAATNYGLQDIPDDVLEQKRHLLYDVVERTREARPASLKGTLEFLAIQVEDATAPLAHASYSILTRLRWDRGTAKTLARDVLESREEEARKWIETNSDTYYRDDKIHNVHTFSAKQGKGMSPFDLTHLRFCTDGRSNSTYGNSLGSLYLRHVRMTDDDLIFLDGLGELASLDLSYTAVNGSGFETLDLPSLRSLWLEGCVLKEDAFDSKLVHQVRGLYLSYSSVTDPMLANLKSTNLRSLRLGQTSITIAGVRHLVALEQLESVGLDISIITEESLHLLGKLKQLKELRVFGDAISKTQLALIRKALPGVELRPAKLVWGD